MDGDESGVNINPQALAIFKQLNTNIENLVKACMKLSQQIDPLLTKLRDVEVTVDEGFLPNLEQLEEKLATFEEFIDVLVEASHSDALGPKAWAVMVLTKLKEIFDMVEEKS